MYLDAVMVVSDDTVVFNSTPTEITFATFTGSIMRPYE
jgi:hypothetical protein